MNELGGFVQDASASGRIAETLVPRARATMSAGLDCGARLRAHRGEAGVQSRWVAGEAHAVIFRPRSGGSCTSYKLFFDPRPRSV